MQKGKEMRKLRNLLMMVVAISTMMAMMIFTVSADEATDLSEMKVYAVDTAGNKTEVPMNFSSTTYEYDLTVKSNVTSIEIEAEVQDSTSKWIVEKDGINTKMDTGLNKTVVAVTSSAGVVQRYTLNTKKLTTEEEATYKEPDVQDGAGADKKKSSDKPVKVGNKTMKITSSFSKDKIPEGFKKSTQKYKGKKYSCIKGEIKDITAFYLYGNNQEGFYIYDADKDKFYLMNNIKIKSRMYTIVQPEKTDGIVEAYKQENVTIIDQKVKAWVLDAEEGMYLVYAMNWNGETNLYCYDDNEKCFQRYLTSSDANRQSEAAAKAYNTLQKDYNKLVDKYNVLIKILCGLVILIIILIFVVINLALNKKEKKIKQNDKYTEDSEDTDENPVMSKKEIKAAKKEAKKAEKAEKKRQKYEQDEDDIDSGIAIDDEEKFQKESEADRAADIQELEQVEEEEIVEKLPESDESVVEDLKEIPSEEEIAEENDEDIAEDTDSDDSLEDNDDDDFELAESTVSDEEDLEETIKSLLPDEQDDDDDDDFEFIDLN